MDLLLPPVRAGGRIAFQLVALCRLVRHDPFAIFSVFVFWICVAVAVATATPVVAMTTTDFNTASSSAAMAVASTPGTEGG